MEIFKLQKHFSPIGCDASCEMYKRGFCRFGLHSKEEIINTFDYKTLRLIEECIDSDETIIVLDSREIDPRYWTMSCTGDYKPFYRVSI